MPRAWSGEGLVAGGGRCSRSLPTGGRGEPKQGEGPGVCVDEEDEAGAPAVLRGRAGACGEGLGLGLFPKRCEFARAWPHSSPACHPLCSHVGLWAAAMSGFWRAVPIC